IILLLITIALAGAAYTYLSIYFQGSTAKTIQVSDAFCASGGVATVVLSNVGTQTLTISPANPCVLPNAIATTTNSQACGDITVVKTNGNFGAAAAFQSGSVTRNGNVAFKDTCGSGTTCDYRFIVSGTAIGAQQASVRC
ncbi:MAG: hypothetical protein HY518_01470, partial [Candidatus Aenigmarchaeota archaeon]|nr:hypothetical protein [Candidatus Aenigmarchaeota archaeon]